MNQYYLRKCVCGDTPIIENDYTIKKGNKYRITCNCYRKTKWCKLRKDAIELWWEISPKKGKRNYQIIAIEEAIASLESGMVGGALMILKECQLEWEQRGRAAR